METGHYVNERRNRPEPRETRHSGSSKISVLVGIGFGLLCIIQVALNVSLRLHHVWSSSRSDNSSACNFTMMSELILERDQLLRDKDRLANENKELQDNNKILSKRVIELVMEINTGTCCPRGWWPHKSTCYQLSSVKGTWQNAKRDCEARGSHLLILNDQDEQTVVRSFGVALEMWMGLSVQEYTSCSWSETCTGTWTWVDGRPLSFADWKCQCSEFPKNLKCNNCAYVDLQSSSKTWGVSTCQQRRYWMCEMQLHQ